MHHTEQQRMHIAHNEMTTGMLKRIQSKTRKDNMSDETFRRDAMFNFKVSLVSQSSL